MKKFITLLSAAVAATVMTASAEVSIDLVSAYVFRGGTINDEFNIQPGFETGMFGELFTVGTWANFNTDTSEFDEIDYYIGYSVPLEGPVTVDIGYTEYVYNVGGEADREPYLALGTSAAGVDFGFLLAYGISGAIDSSLYIELSAGYAVPVSEDIEVALGAALGYADPDEGESGFSHLTLDAGVDLPVGEDYSISLGLSYVIETDEDVLAVDEDFYFTIGTVL